PSENRQPDRLSAPLVNLGYEDILVLIGVAGIESPGYEEVSAAVVGYGPRFVHARPAEVAAIEDAPRPGRASVGAGKRLHAEARLRVGQPVFGLVYDDGLDLWPRRGRCR